MSSYRTHPVHRLDGLEISHGYDALAGRIEAALRHSGGSIPVLIDGFSGLPWRDFTERLRTALEQRGVTLHWHPTEKCLLPSPEIESILHSYLTDDPVFGRLYRGRLEEFWDEARVAALRRALDGSGPSIVGYGASLLAEGAYRIYVDVPKDTGQERAAHGQIVNVGAHTPESFGAMYKRMYFVDWPMLNWIKCHHRAPKAL